MDPWRSEWTGSATREHFFLIQTQAENNGDDGDAPPPHSSWTAAIHSGGRGARRYQSHQRTQGNVLWQRGGRGWLRGWVRPLCCRWHSNLHCIRSDIGNTPSINRRSVLEAPLCFICIGYHWISSDLSGKAEKWSNCEMRSNIMHELWGAAGEGR